MTPSSTPVCAHDDAPWRGEGPLQDQSVPANKGSDVLNRGDNVPRATRPDSPKGTAFMNATDHLPDPPLERLKRVIEWLEAWKVMMTRAGNAGPIVLATDQGQPNSPLMSRIPGDDSPHGIAGRSPRRCDACGWVFPQCSCHRTDSVDGGICQACRRRRDAEHLSLIASYVRAIQDDVGRIQKGMCTHHNSAVEEMFKSGHDPVALKDVTRDPTLTATDGSSPALLGALSATPIAKPHSS